MPLRSAVPLYYYYYGVNVRAMPCCATPDGSPSLVVWNKSKQARCGVQHRRHGKEGEEKTSLIYRLVFCRVLRALPRIGQASRRVLRRAVSHTDLHIGLPHEETQTRPDPRRDTRKKKGSAKVALLHASNSREEGLTGRQRPSVGKPWPRYQ